VVHLSGDVVVASGNAGKIAELQRLFADRPVTLHLQSEMNVVPAEETGVTFVENALLKARAAAQQTGLPAIADDSGLAVDALGGAPGVRSARYAQDAGAFGGAGDKDAANRQQLLTALEGVPDSERGACFYCALVYLRSADDPTPLIAEGRWNGIILTAERGSGGFGYDPLFLVPELDLSAAELDPSTKNSISHRGKAVQALLARLGPG
jgi:XTP/dITP diphosphohydrolase